MMNTNQVDYSKAIAKKNFAFTPFRPESSTALEAANLRPDEDLMIMEIQDKRYAFLLKQLTYHHVAQGEIEGEPYLVSF